MLQRAAAAAAGRQSRRAGTLYVVATPIGNLADLTLRAIHLLGQVDAVACEDTRVSAQLLNHLGWHKPLIALHAHNEQAAAATVLARLAQGESVAYVSDAGTPAVSDPGAALVAAVAAAGHPVVPLPGPSSVLAALSVAGDAAGATGPDRGFVVVGFLPAKGGDRRSALAAVLAERRTQVLLEAPHRIGALLDALAGAAPQRRLTLARELTKQFEQVVTLDAAEAPGWLAADAQRQRGEFVLVLHALPAAAPQADALPAPALHALAVLQRELPLAQAVALAAEIGGAPRKALYRHALAQRDGSSDPADDPGEAAGA
ncbi:MAG: 16S rRNA (cytidine(1402)-2'-O)-methyltransferase [Rubrivivax sp.]|nr:16S rRNA (cytidine(1402)-2'-O)-methyltransferase [Rubrivivax sp.]